MRAAPLLASFALLDLAIVGGTGLDPGIDARELRAPLLGIVAVTGAGVVALASLACAERWLHRLGSLRLRATAAFALGLAYGAAPLAFLAWTGLWLTALHLPVAIAGAACVVMILWQGVGARTDDGRTR